MGLIMLETETERRAETVLPSLPVGQVCPLCGGEGVPVGVKEGVCLRECCGCLLAWKWESEAQYLGFYADMEQFHGEQQEREGHLPTIQRDSEHLRASRSRIRVLYGLYPHLTYGTRLMDVGAGGGSFVAACEEIGWEAFGVEPCAELAQWAYTIRRNVQPGTWYEVEGEWEVITLHDVVEHLTRPASCLSYLRSCLSENGLLIVEMPEWDSPQAKAEGLHWRHVLPKQHPCLYSDGAAQELFRQCGLKVEAAVRPLRGAIGKIVYYLSSA